MKLKLGNKRTGKLMSTIKGSIESSRPEQDYRRVQHYRLDFINENKFTRLWSLRMTRWRVALASLILLAGIAAIIIVLLLYTPLGRLFPGQLSRAARMDYVEMSLRLDSLERRARTTSVYADNVRRILNGEALDDPRNVSSEVPVTLPVDSLLPTSDAEKQFVQRLESEENYNLSVLTPIAAQGMTFLAPVSPGPDGFIRSDNPKGITVPAGTTTGVSAAYRGTVINRYTDAWGRHTITVQHPNDFISVYSGLDDVLVGKGDKVATGQRLGHVAPGGQLWVELWYNGSAIAPEDYLPM